MEQERQTNAIERSDKTCKIELSITKSQTVEQITRNDGGRPYLRMLSTKIRTAQKCIQELNTCTIIIAIHKQEMRYEYERERRQNKFSKPNHTKKAFDSKILQSCLLKQPSTTCA